MSDTLPQRPTFSNGQYIGADDLNAAVDYARDKIERLTLSGLSWGIGTGLALVEIVDATGATQMYVEPGVAWDGYGRTIVVVSPAAVTADLFAGLPSGNQTVWLKYRTLDTQMISPGFQTCGAGDPATRIAETYAIVTTAPTVVQQNDGIVLNGVAVLDPRNMLIAFNAAAAVVLDGSAPHQLFPDDSAEWLVPVGIVSYNSATGTFNPRTPAQLALNRVARRYAGAVVESVLAADGVLRLRDRQTDQQSGLTNDDLDAAASVQTTDVQTDPNNPTRLIGNELVWVEGAMRVLGDARLWGGELSLRAKDGTEPAGSLFVRRNADATNPATVQNLEVSIGQQPSGTAVNRLLVAASNPATATTSATLVTPPALSVGTDARVGIGVAVPGAGLTLDIKGDFGHDGDPTTLHLNGSAIAGQNDGSLLLTSSSGMIELGADGALTHVAIGTKSPQADAALDIHGGGIAVNNSNAFLRLLGSAVIDQDDGILRIRSGGNVVAFDGFDNVGIGTTAPTALLHVAGAATVNGALTVWGSILNPSDARLKKNIRPLKGALERLLALRGVEFEWKRADLARLRPGRHAGLIADEVEKVFPGWVHDDPGSGMKLLAAQGFEALAVEALRELAERVEALEQENRRLAQLLSERSGAEPEPPAAISSGKERAKGKPRRQGQSDRGPSPGKPSRG